MKVNKRKRNAWTIVALVLLITYYLSSIPGLRVLPVLKQISQLLQRFDLSLTLLAARIIALLPEQMAPAKTFTGDFYVYARENPVIMEFLLRKMAHVILFFIVTIAFYLLLSQYLKTPGAAAVLAFMAGAGLAFLDEYHQSFVDQRSGNIVDVGIDMLGVTLALVMIVFSFFLTERWRF